MKAFEILCDNNAPIRVGILGGSFDPPHEGHIYISLQAIKRLNLHHVVWIVTPNNPSKHGHNLSLADRVQKSKELTNEYRHYIAITDIESVWRTEYGKCYSIHTIQRIRLLWPNAEIFWLMGGDNFESLHKWYRWNNIVDSVNVVAFSRSEGRNYVSRSMVQQKKSNDGQQMRILSVKHVPISSTDIRNKTER